MNALTFIYRSALHYRRAHLGLLAGTALAAAILTGALVVGDSVGYTLRTYAMERLGKIEIVVTSGERLFAGPMAAALQTKLSAPVATVFALPGMAIFQDNDSGKKTQVNKIQALGVDAAFWSLSNANAAAPELGRREAALDVRLAAQLGAKVGDTVALRIAKPGLLSRDAPLSSREEDVSTRANFTVKSIVSDEQLGRFSLAGSQLPPYNYFVNLKDLQDLAGTAGQANLLLVGAGASRESVESGLKEIWKPEFAGLKIEPRTDKVLQLESDRIFIDAATEKAALALPGARGALTYLVNAIQSGEKVTPYSFMTAADSALTAGLREDEVVINSWLADKLGIGEGASINVKYYEVLPSNKFEERTRAFTVKRVYPIEEFASEKALVPEFPGLSNVESCKDWKIGMPMDQDLLKDEANEAYWKAHRQTPKALISLAAGQALWSNRFGRLTGVRFDSASAKPEELMAALAEHLSPRDVGLEARAVRAEADASLAQSGELGMLFLGMSFFLLGAALILTALLYAFGAQQRAEELGVLAAVGFTRSRIRALMLGEVVMVAIPGAILGAGLGMGYAWILLIGLARYWQDAIGRIPILFSASGESIGVGIFATILCALITATLTVRRLLNHSVNELIHADFTQAYKARPARRGWTIAAIFFALAAAGLVLYALVAPPPDPAETFFSSGFLALAAGLLFAWRALSPAPQPGERVPTFFSLAKLNATRRRGRSLGMIASLAAGGFLVLATSAMQSDVNANADKRWAGTGGFALYAESTVPILDPADLVKAAPAVTPLGVRVFDGDDASCLNLNHAVRPRVVGVDPAVLASLKAFVDESDADMWSLLDRDLGDGSVPALVGDSDTAMYTLQKNTGLDSGDTITYRDGAGHDVNLKLVGRLPMRASVFQGTILISAKNFTKLWPASEGFRLFLIDTAADARAEAIAQLQDKFDRFGLDVVPTTARLALFHAVEGTYLSMFLVLGGIGLLLGSAATGIVVLRNLLERRREIALLRAVGFSPRDLFQLLAYEYGTLLVIAAVIGAAASVVAMLPALTAAHGAGSVIARLAAFGGVIGAAAISALAALPFALRRPAPLNAE